MCRLFDEWTGQIKEYWEINGLNYEKAKHLSKSWGRDNLVLQYFDSESECVKKGLGLLDETPMPIVLRIRKNGNKLVFEQTEHTKKYLA